MSTRASLELSPYQTNRTIVIGLYLFYLAGIGRTLVNLSPHSGLQPRLGWVLALELIFLLFFTLVLWRPPSQGTWLYLYFGFQSALIVTILALYPQLDFVTSFFVLLSHQVAWLFSGRTRWAWVIGFGVIIGGSLALFLGPLRGLALGLVAIAGQFVVLALVISLQEVETARARSQAMLLELQATQDQLRLYASQVEELAAIEERNRLARELHDSVSQTLFSVQLNTHSAQLLLEKNPVRVRAQLEILQDLVQSALAEMRKLITQMRIKGE